MWVSWAVLLLRLGAQGRRPPYSRSLESRADQGGLMLMARAITRKQPLPFGKKMNKLEGAGGHHSCRLTLQIASVLKQCVKLASRDL